MAFFENKERITISPVVGRVKVQKYLGVITRPIGLRSSISSIPNHQSFK
jgi:hypothetical protein